MARRRRRRQGLRITPLGYVVLGLIVAVMLVGVYFIIWSLSGQGQKHENLSSASVSITPTPSLPPVEPLVPASTATPTIAPTEVPTQAPETPSPTPKLDDTPPPQVRTPSPSQVQVALDGKTTSKLRLRQGPGESYPILGTYSAGTKLKVYARENDFYFVMVVKENVYGYMSAEYVEKSGLLEGESADAIGNLPSGAVAGTVSASVVALRNVPSTVDNKAFGQLERGVAVYVYFEVDGFYYLEVAASGTKGYAKAEFITVTDAVPTGTPKP